MGDIADYLIERMVDAGAWHRTYGPPLTCKHCGATGLYWQKVRGRYFIHERATLERHHCPPNAEGFEDLT